MSVTTQSQRQRPLNTIPLIGMVSSTLVSRDEGMYETYYIQSSGQPANNKETHESLQAAIESWRSNCSALFARSGGKSVLVDLDDGEDLIWTEHACGAMANRLLENMEPEDIETPDKVAALIAPKQGT